MQAKAISGYATDKAGARDYFSEKISNGNRSLANRYGYALALSENGQFKEARAAISALLNDYPGHVSVRQDNA